MIKIDTSDPPLRHIKDYFWSVNHSSFFINLRSPLCQLNPVATHWRTPITTYIYLKAFEWVDVTLSKFNWIPLYIEIMINVHKRIINLDLPLWGHNATNYYLSQIHFEFIFVVQSRFSLFEQKRLLKFNIELNH